MKTLLSYYSVSRNFLSSTVFNQTYRFLHTTIQVLSDSTDTSGPILATPPNVTNKAPKLLYDLPEPIQYTGYHLIEINFPDNYFTLAYRKNSRELLNPRPVTSPIIGLATTSPLIKPGQHIGSTATYLRTLTESDINEKMKNGLLSSNLVHGLTGVVGDIKLSATGLVATDNLTLSSDMKSLTARDFKRFADDQKALMLYKGNSGAVYYKVIPAPSEEIRPRFIIAERYNMSSYLGNYAPGRVLKTHTLAPGETTTLSVKTFRKSQQSYKESSSIFDSFHEDSEKEFNKSLSDEQSDKQSENENFSYHADMEASGSWGCAKASASAGVAGGAASAREEFAKTTSNAASREAAKASSKREVHVNTESENQYSEGEETSTERIIKNINVSRTMNLVFRQMNQQYITLTYLTDVKVGFFNNVLAQKKEVAISRLADLIEETIVPSYHKKVTEGILSAINSFIDYKDKYQPLTERYIYKDPDNANPPKIEYDRFIKKITTYTTKDSDGNITLKIDVPGYILNTSEAVIRTEGVIMDAFLGEGNALDSYSQKLQMEANRKNMLENDSASLEMDKAKLGMDVVKGNNTSQGKIFSTIFHKPVACCPTSKSTEEENSPNPSDTPTRGPTP